MRGMAPCETSHSYMWRRFSCAKIAGDSIPETILRVEAMLSPHEKGANCATVPVLSAQRVVLVWLEPARPGKGLIGVQAAAPLIVGPSWNSNLFGRSAERQG